MKHPSKRTYVAAAAALSVVMFAGSAALADEGRKERGTASESAQPVDDTWITTKVKASLLAESNVSGLDIDVETVNGVVTLRGDVDDATQIEKARAVASDIEGVSRVDTSALVVARGGER